MKTAALLFVVCLIGVAPSGDLWAQTTPLDSLEAHLATLEGPDRLPVLLDVARQKQGRAPAETVAHAREALRWLTAAPDDAIEISALYLIANAFRAQSLYDSTLAYTARLKPLTRRARDDERLADALRLEAIVYTQRGDAQHGLDAFEEVLVLREAVGDPAAIASALNNIGIAQRRLGQFDEALAVYQRALAILQAEGANTGGVLSNLGIIYSQRGQMDTARDYLLQARDAHEASGNAREAANTLSTLGFVAKSQGDYETSERFYQEALATYRAISYPRGQASVLTNIGGLYQRQGQFEKALRARLDALALFEQLGAQEGVASALSEIATLHLELGDTEDALPIQQRALAIREAIGDQIGIGDSWINLGSTYRQLQRTDEARAAYQRALAIYDAAGATGHLGRAYLQLANLSVQEQSFAPALPLYEQSLAALRSADDPLTIGEALLGQGRALMALGQTAEAGAAFDEALSVGRGIQALPLLQQAYQARAGFFEAQGQYQPALADFQQFKALGDSLLTTDKQAILSELQTRFQTRQQQQQIQLLEQDRQIAALWRNGLIGGLLVAGLIAFLIFSRLRFQRRANHALTQAHEQLKNTQAQLIQSEKMASLGRLTAGIAHEIKNPLNFVNNFSSLSVDLLEELEETLAEPADQRDEGLLREVIDDLRANQHKINEHGRRADDIVHGMMNHARPSTGKRQPTDLNELVQEAVRVATSSMQTRYPGFEVHLIETYTPDLPTVPLVPKDLSQVCYNVLDNALYALHTHSQAPPSDAYTPTLHITTTRSGEHLLVRITDNGPGFDAATKGQLFEPFFTTKPTGKGNTGLGLSLSYDIVTGGHGGQLLAEDAPDGGAVFVIRLPLAPTAEPVLA